MALKITLQILWLIASGAAVLASLSLRRLSVNLIRDPLSTVGRFFRAQSNAWCAVAVEIVTALIARAVLPIFLPDTLLVILFLSVALIGRVYQVGKLWQASALIINGKH